MDRILGQDRAVELLQSVLRSGRVHHAWIFAGPRGVGKFTTAVEFARILLDPGAGPDLAGRISADPAGQVSRLIDAGTHPDLRIVRKELALFSDNPELRRKKLSNIPLDVLREHVVGGRTTNDKYFEPAAGKTAAMGQGKVFIIDEAELIDPTGQNALLKTLEEPPPQTWLVLITAYPQRLLPTVRSRCQSVSFGPLRDEPLREWARATQLTDDPGELAWLLQFCNGSPGTAQMAARFGFYQWQQEIAGRINQLIGGRFPADLGTTLGKLVEAFATAHVKDNKNASKDAANKEGVHHLLSLLACTARAGLERSAGEAVDGDDPETAYWLAVTDLLRDAEWQISRNVNLKQVLENLCAQWSNLRLPQPAGRR